MSFDDILRKGLSLVLYVELNDKQWSRVNLPIHIGGLGMRSACMLAPSAFLASAAATLPLQDAILAGSVQGIEDQAVTEAMNSWTSLSQQAVSADATKHVQKAWDTPISEAVFQRLLDDVNNTSIDIVRLRTQMNDLVWRAVKKTRYPTVKKPAGLGRTDGKRPDGATLMPWIRGKPLAGISPSQIPTRN